MLRQQSIKYGSRSVEFTLPEDGFVRCLESDAPPPSASPSQLLTRSLQQPLGSPPLRQIAAGKGSAAILIPGRARRAGTREYVPALLTELNAAGIPDRQIEIFLADGTHEQHLQSDVEALLGTEIATRVRCSGHDCKREEELAELGTTRFGTSVLLNRRVLKAEVKILTGRIVPHYFAGFSGGRKALIPGVAGYRTIVANHRLTLAPQRGIHPGVRLCSLEGNPVHEDMLEGARMARPDFCLNSLLDENDRMVSVVAGDPEIAHEQGCREAEQMFHLTMPEPVDGLITSAGGLPYDCNFMQSLKAVFNVRDIVRPGGAILWVAECAGGIHPGFLQWAAIESDTELDKAVRARYLLTGHNSLMLRSLIRNADVALCSALPAEMVLRLGLHPVASIEEGVQWIRGKFPRSFTYAVAPRANAICATLERGSAKGGAL
jgi:lactate racemase